MRHFKLFFRASVLSTLATSTVLAAGFQIQEQNVTNLGLAYAGTAALAQDASTAFYNAAGLTRIKGQQLVLSGVLISSDSDFTTQSSGASFASGANGPNPFPVSGHAEFDGGGYAPVPAIHYSAEITDKIFFGLSIAPQFGLKTHYGENDQARYMATRSELRTVDISPSLAFKVARCLSVAAGFDAEYAKAHLDAQLGIQPLARSLDGFQRNHASDWAWGWHVGLLWEPTKGARVGISYRSLLNFDTEGQSEQVNPTAGPALAPSTIVPVTAKITLPETLYLSGYYDITQNWAVVADVHWTAWSRFRTLRIRYDGSPLRTETDTFEHFKDTWRLALGGIYKPCEKLHLRFGAAWDQSPVKEEYRTARVPDSDRIWLGIGAGYALAKSIWVDVGYAHLFFKKANLHETAPFRAQTTTPVTAAFLNGDYDSSADVFGLQIRWDFG